VQTTPNLRKDSTKFCGSGNHIITGTVFDITQSGSDLPANKS